MKQIALILLLSFSIFGAKIGRQATDSVAEYTGLGEYIAARVDSNKTFYVAKPVVVTANTTLEKNLILGGVVNNATITINSGVTLTINAAGEDFQDSCFRGSGNLIFDACATSYFDTRWIGSSTLSYSWIGCDGDTVRFTSFQASTAGIGAATITSGYFDSLYASQKIGADSIYARASRTNKLYVSDSLQGPLNIGGTARINIGPALLTSTTSSNPQFNIMTNCMRTNSYVNSRVGRCQQIRTNYRAMYFSYSPHYNTTNNTITWTDIFKVDSADSWFKSPLAVNKATSPTIGYALDVNGKILADDTIVAPYFKGSIINGSELKLKIPGVEDYARIYAQSATPGGNNSIWIDSLVAAQTFVFSNNRLLGSTPNDTISEMEQIIGCYHIDGGNPWYGGSYIDNFNSVSADSGHFRALLIDTRVDSARSAERADWADEAYYSQMAGDAEFAHQLYLDGNVYVTSLDSVKINGTSGIGLATAGDIKISGANVDIAGNINIEDPIITGKATVDSISVRRVYTRSITFTNGLRYTAGTSIDLRADHQSFVTLNGTGDWSFIADAGTVLYIESNAPNVRVYRVSDNSGTAYSVASGTMLMMVCRNIVNNVSTWAIFRDTDS